MIQIFFCQSKVSTSWTSEVTWYICLIFTGVSISTLWPATGIKSFVTEKMNVPDKMLRKPEIFADAILTMANESTDKYVLIHYQNHMTTSDGNPSNVYKIGVISL